MKNSTFYPVVVLVVAGFVFVFAFTLRPSRTSPSEPPRNNAHPPEQTEKRDQLQENPTAQESKKPNKKPERPWQDPVKIDKGPFELLPTDEKVQEAKKLFDAASRCMENEEYGEALAWFEAMENIRTHAESDPLFEERAKELFEKKAEAEKLCLLKHEEFKEKVKRGDIIIPRHGDYDPRKDK